MHHPPIRPGCLLPAPAWERPTGDEVKIVLRLAGLTGRQAAVALGLGAGGDRTVRRWTSGAPISYANWALLCDFAGIPPIWKAPSGQTASPSDSAAAPDSAQRPSAAAILS